MGWKCSECGTRIEPATGAWLCTCGGVLDSDEAPVLRPESWAGRPATMWRYLEALPGLRGAAVSLGEPITPLVAMEVEGIRLLVKQEQLFSTGSYKDRGAAFMISRIGSLGIREVVEDSSGNAGCAVAAYSARAGIRCEVYVPASTSPGKLVQMEAYGATVRRIPGTREATAQAVREAARERFYASHTYNPWFIDGVKTVAYELAEQLSFRAPDWLVLPAGNGTLLLGCWKGFRELVEAGLLERMPRLVGVQAEACAPLVDAWMAGLAAPRAVATRPTAAEGIAIAAPARGAQMLRAVSESGGQFVAVTEQAISASQQVAGQAGFFVEPTAAVGLAGALKLARSGVIHGTVVTVFTGHGLKALGHG